jgi:hypothetical protein
VLSLRCRTFGPWLLALGLVGSCAVFPDEATLPAGSSTAGSAGAGGTTVVAHSGSGGRTDGGAGASAVAGGAEGGSLGTAGVPGQAGAGGETSVVGGAAGAGTGGTAPCLNPEQQVVAVTADTWIDAAKSGASHANDAELSVVGGTTGERRALLQVMLPAVPAGKVLNQASLVLHLLVNADATGKVRSLGLHQLQQEVVESRATWTNYANGNAGKWLTPGGDFGPELSTAAVRAGMANGTVTFFITAPVRKIMGATAIPLPVIVLEKGLPPPAPAALAFTSSEGDASSIPALILEFCDQ